MRPPRSIDPARCAAPSRRLRHAALAAGLALGACTPDAPRRSLADAEVPRAERLERMLSVLAADSMAGRRTGTPGAARAAAFLAAELERYGVEPAGEAGFAQPVPLARVQVRGRLGLALPSPALDFDTLDPSALVQNEGNVVGIIRGSDPELTEEAVVIGAHFDHVGVGRPVDGDSIYNGADDDGSGVVAILEIARDLATRGPPRRSVVVLLSTAEEFGILGSRYYVDHPAVPLERTVANLQIEMIGRPDSLAGGFGRGWLTGYERTTVGDRLRAAGSPIVPDPRPEQSFFTRSDNIVLARAGIPAHTLSSYDMHEDYHRPSDEVERIDFAHMAALVEAAIEAVRLLADGPAPAWNPGGREGLGRE